jgi:redox-regulated HSP33 family molecular chaperone
MAIQSQFQKVIDELGKALS